MVQNLPDNVALEKTSQPAFSKAMKTIKGRIKKGEIAVPVKAKTAPKLDRGVVYLSHIPHGFYEKEMRGFLKQFGEVTRLRLARSKKTGRSKGYAFIEFRHKEVAQIVAETMNNYLMFTKLVKAKYLPPEEVNEAIFFGRVFAPESCPGNVARNRERRLSNRPLTAMQVVKKKRQARRKLTSMQQKLKELGINYEIQIGGDVLETTESAATVSTLQKPTPSVTPKKSPTPRKSPKSTPASKKSPSFTPKTKPKSPKTPGSMKRLQDDLKEDAIVTVLPPYFTPKSTPVMEQSKTPKSAKKTPLSVPAMEKMVTPKSAKKTPASTPVKGKMETPKSTNKTPLMEQSKTPKSAKKTPASTPVKGKMETPKSANKTPLNTPVMEQSKKPKSAKKTPLSVPAMEKMVTPKSAKKSPLHTPVSTQSLTPKMKTPSSEKKIKKSPAQLDLPTEAPVTKAKRKSVLKLPVKTPSPRKTRSGKILSKKTPSPGKALTTQTLESVTENVIPMKGKGRKSMQPVMESEPVTSLRKSMRRSIAVMKAESPVTRTPKRQSMLPAGTPKKSKLI